MKKKKTAKLWYNGEIPARLFFEVLKTQDLSLLKRNKGKAKEVDLKRNWANIYDEYFELKDDPKLVLIIRTQTEIIQMIRQVEIVRQAVYAISSVQFDKDQMASVIKGITDMGFSFDPDNPLDSVLQIIKYEIPSIETRIEIEKDNLKNLTQGAASTFEDTCVAYESWGYKIDENCSLRRYIAYERAVKQKASKQRNDGKR